MSKKKIMRRFRIREISGVDTPAQEGAEKVIMKRDNPEYAKTLFNEALEDLQLEAKVNDALMDMWQLDSALSRSIREIIEDDEEYPDTMAAIKESLQQFAAAVSTTVAGVLDGVKDNQDPDNKETTMTEEEKKAALEKEALEKAAADEKKVLEARVAKAESINALAADDKAHYDTLAEAGQDEWLAKSADDRTAFLKNLADENAIIYTAEDGSEYRKSDDPRLVAMAKKADEETKAANVDRAAREDTEFAKRADAELKHLPGEQDVKVAILKALETISDETTRKAATEMIHASNADMSKAMDRIGTTGEDTSGPKGKLNALAKKHQEANEGMSFEKAYTEVITTDEGKALYNQTQA